MLVKLLPDQISRFWPYIKYALEQSVPLDILKKNDKMNNILESLLFDGMHAWLEIDQERLEVLGCLVTTIWNDESSKTKALRLYSVFSYDDLPPQTWAEGFHTLSEFARGKGCEFIDAFSENEGVIRLARRFGGDTRFTYITLEI
jgi:hypothetical protein